LFPETIEALRHLGHTVDERSGFSGDVQSILIQTDGVLSGFADPRRGGAAVGLRQVRQVFQ
jgi:gamma-glutamyltranspeptidase/glutathione hydrolase